MGAGTDGRDLAKVVTGNVSAPGTISLGVWRGRFNITFSGGSGVAATIQKSYDNGSTWHNLTALGATVVFTAGTEPIEETELGVLFRVNVTAITSGTLTVRASQ
jgi:hypothetical protein